MKKSARTIAMMFALTVAATPFVHAEPMGTNPRPQTTSSTSSVVMVAYTILTILGH